MQDPLQLVLFTRWTQYENVYNYSTYDVLNIVSREDNGSVGITFIPFYALVIRYCCNHHHLRYYKQSSYSIVWYIHT